MVLFVHNKVALYSLFRLCSCYPVNPLSCFTVCTTTEISATRQGHKQGKGICHHSGQRDRTPNDIIMSLLNFQIGKLPGTVVRSLALEQLCEAWLEWQRLPSHLPRFVGSLSADFGWQIASGLQVADPWYRDQMESN